MIAFVPNASCVLDETKRCLPTCDSGISGPCIRLAAGNLSVERERLQAMLIGLRRRIAELEVSLELAQHEEEIISELLEEQG